MPDKPSLDYLQAGEQLTRDGFGWSPSLNDPITITYAFRTGEPAYDNLDAGGYAPFNSAQIAMTLLALQGWSDVANINFNRVGNGDSGGAAYSDKASILFGNYLTGVDGAAAFTYLPGGAGEGGSRGAGSPQGDVWVNASFDYNSAPSLLSYGMLALVHEIGHALGLEHPGDYDADPNREVNYGDDAEFREDSLQYSIMSYFSETNTGAYYGESYPMVPQIYDIAAIQRLYGANMSTRTGDTVYGLNSNTDRPWFDGKYTPIYCIWDAGGNDTLDYSCFNAPMRLDMREGMFSDVGGWVNNVSIAPGTIIENAIGGQYYDYILGNGADNDLDGRLGMDTLIGGDGDDILRNGEFIIGGAGNDTAIFEMMWVVVNMATGSLRVGADKGKIIGVENLYGGFYSNIIIGNGDSNYLSGNRDVDTLSGSGGSDTIHGGGGSDELRGGRGADCFVYELRSDSSKYGGVDTIYDLANEDKIDLSGLDANPLIEGDQSFEIVTGKFHRPGEIRLEYNTLLDETSIVINMDSDRGGEMIIHLMGNHMDFINFVL